MSDSANDAVLVRREGPVAIATLNYPERRNAFSLKMRQATHARLSELMYHDNETRAIVLTGAAGTFCAGGDISEMKERTVLEFRERNLLPLEVFKMMVTGPKPIVAAVEGAAMGAGISLAAACDYVVAASNARFCAAFVRVGLLPDTGLYWTLAQRVGAGRAREMMMLATEIAGARAAEIGLANRVVEPGQALETAMEVALQYAAMPPLTSALLKAALATGCNSIEDAIETEINMQPILRRSQDHKEAAKAFMEKRKPVFIGN